VQVVTHQGSVPLCPCGGMLRPGVVWFGEQLPEGALDAAVSAVATCDPFLCVGTSGMVYPAASLPDTDRANSVPVIEINVEETPLTPFATHHLSGLSDMILPELVAAWETQRYGTSTIPRVL
jgi:NAD-dependent deacetylase